MFTLCACICYLDGCNHGTIDYYTDNSCTQYYTRTELGDSRFTQCAQLYPGVFAKTLCTASSQPRVFDNSAVQMYVLLLLETRIILCYVNTAVVFIIRKFCNLYCIVCLNVLHYNYYYYYRHAPLLHTCRYYSGICSTPEMYSAWPSNTCYSTTDSTTDLKYDCSTGKILHTLLALVRAGPLVYTLYYI